MPGRRFSDASDLLAMLMALFGLACVFFIAWGLVIGFIAASWALFKFLLRIWGAA